MWGSGSGSGGEVQGLKARDEDAALVVEAFRLCRGLIGEWIDALDSILVVRWEQKRFSARPAYLLPIVRSEPF